MTSLVLILLLSSPWVCRGFDVNAHHDLGPGFLSQSPPTDRQGHVHRVVGYTFREEIHESNTPFLVKFCDGPCFDTERGTLMPLIEIAEMMDEKKSGKIATFNYILNDLEKGLEHYRDGAKDSSGNLPPTFLVWVPSIKEREAGANVVHYRGAVTKAAMLEWLETLKVPLGRTVKERNARRDEL